MLLIRWVLMCQNRGNELRCLRFLVQMARANNVPIKSFNEYYLELSKQASSH